MQDSNQEFRNQMAAQFDAWKTEMTELLRLNRPPPPVMDPSSVQGRGCENQQHHGEGSCVPGRRFRKEPATNDDPVDQEMGMENEGHGENTPAFRGVPRGRDLEWAPRKGDLEVRQQN